METKKILAIHHNDLDGISSGMLLLEYFNNVLSEDISINVDYHTYNYGKVKEIDKFLDINYLKKSEYDFIIFVDVTPPNTFYGEFINSDLKSKIIIIDHHQMAYNNYQHNSDNIIYIFDNNICGALLLSKNLIKLSKILIDFNILSDEIEQNILDKILDLNNKYSNYLHLVDSYDTWKWYNSDIKYWSALHMNEYFLENIFEHNSDIKKCFDLFNESDVDLNNKTNFDNHIINMINIGSFISNRKLEEVKKQKFLFVENNGICFALVNNKANFYQTEYIKNLAIDSININKQIKFVMYYGMIEFVDNIASLNISLRGIDDEFNCAKYVSTLCGGGGHKSAAGGQISLSKFKDFIENKIII